MNASAITANDPLGILGVISPLKTAGRSSSFVNLFSAFESSAARVTVTARAMKSATTVTKSAAPVKSVTASSQQIAESMIRSMLGSPVNSLVVNAKVSQPVTIPQTVAPAAAEIQDVSHSEPDHANETTAGAGDSLVRSMLGLQSSAAPSWQDEAQTGAADESANREAAVESAAAQSILAGLDATPEVNPEIASLPDALPSPKGSPQKIQNAPQTTAPAPTVRPEQESAAAGTAAPTAPLSTLTPAPKSETPVATRTGNDLTVRAMDVAARPGLQPINDMDSVERTAEPARNSGPAPLAFSVELTPTATPTPTDTSVDTPPLPERGEAVAASQPMASQPMVPEGKSIQATEAAVSESDKAPAVAPEKSENGNTGRRDEGSPEREAQEPARTTATGAGEVSGGWSMNAAPVVADAAMRPAIEPAVTAQPASAMPQIIEADSNAAVKTGGTAQDITVRISQPDSPAVDLHVTERAGEIHVAVRTSDAELQTSLRQDLGSLTSSLERAGYHAETFVPRAAAASQSNLREERQQQGSAGRGGSQSESGNGRQKGQREQRGPSWTEELEQSK